MTTDNRCTAVNRFGTRCRADAFRDGLCAFHRRIARHARKLHGPYPNRPETHALAEVFLAAALRK
jgi:hypothetical protein